MSERVAKQIIVMRKDLNMRKGKMIAQGAHASLGAVLIISGERSGHEFRDPNVPWPDYHAAYDQWINGTFTKICVSVDSEEALRTVFLQADEAGLPVKLIEDSGATEFHGVPTLTCLAIGPAWADDIDKITVHASRPRRSGRRRYGLCWRTCGVSSGVALEKRGVHRDRGPAQLAVEMLRSIVMEAA